MDYGKHYNNLISRARNRKLVGRCERHHIIPKCMGGSNHRSNLVDLSYKEHIVAHLLLTKMYPDHPKLICAAQRMTNGSNAKRYGWVREQFAEYMSISQTGSNNNQYGTRWIYNDTIEQSMTIPVKIPTPVGWKDGRKMKFRKKCKVCGNDFPNKSLTSYCSNRCKRHDKAPSNKIIDDNVEQMVEYYLTHRSITGTLKHFGVEGTRAGNAYLSSILKSRGIGVRPKTGKAGASGGA